MRSCFVLPGVRRIHGDPRLCCETPVGVVYRTLAGRSSLCHSLDKMLHSVASKGEKVADRPDEGVIRCFYRLEILNGVAARVGHRVVVA